MKQISNTSHRWLWLALGGLVILVIVLKLIVAAPVWLHYDENYYLNLSQHFVDHGRMTHRMWRMDDFTNVIAGAGPGYATILLVSWMKLAGVTLLNGRIMMIAVGLLTAVVMYFVGKKWWGTQAAGVVAFVFALVSTSPFYSLVFRMDAMGMLAYSVVLLLHIHTVQTRSRWLHFALGIALVVAVEFHIQGIPYIIALTLWYLLEYIGEVRTQRRLVLNTGFVYYAVGGLIAGLIYMAVHILPDPAAYFAIPSDCTQCGTNLWHELIRYARFVLLRPIEFVLVFFTVITAVYRRQPEDRNFIVLLVGWLFAQFALGTSPFTHYTYHMWPILAVGTAGFITRGMRPHGQLLPWRVGLGGGLVAMSLVFNIGTHLIQKQPFELRRTYANSPTAMFVTEVIPHETVIMGEVETYYTLLDFHNFMSYRGGEQKWIELRGETQLDFWRRERPLVIMGVFEDDPELDIYKDELDFVQIQADVWIAGELQEELNLPISSTVALAAFRSAFH